MQSILPDQKKKKSIFQNQLKQIYTKSFINKI